MQALVQPGRLRSNQTQSDALRRTQTHSEALTCMQALVQLGSLLGAFEFR
jgi:hypothetical protein